MNYFESPDSNLVLPIVDLPSGVSVAFVDCSEEVQIIDRISSNLIARIGILPVSTVIVTSETKGIPYAQSVARQCGIGKIVIARKSVKPYWEGYESVSYRAVTHKEESRLYLSSDDIEFISKAKRVVIIDDVISSGESVEAMKALIRKARFEDEIEVVAPFKEGNSYSGKCCYLYKLPVWRREGDALVVIKESL